MKIDIRKIADLAMLEIPPGREEKFRTEMQEFVDMVEHFPEDLSGDLIPSEADAMILRKDEITESLPREEILKNAPQTAAGCVVTPRAIG